MDPTARRPSALRRWLRRALLAFGALVGLVLLYFLAALVGALIAVDGEAVQDPDGVRVYVTSNGVHADVWVPVRVGDRDWSDWLPLDELGGGGGGYLGFGWGERSFYLETPTWDDLTAGNALRALLWPTSTLMHVTYLWSAPRDAHELRLSAASHARLVEYLRSGFAVDEGGRPRLVEHPGYHGNDRFFEGRGRYHLLRTCNHWTNGALKAAGVRTALWAPFEASVTHHLPPVGGR